MSVVLGVGFSAASRSDCFESYDFAGKTVGQLKDWSEVAFMRNAIAASNVLGDFWVTFERILNWYSKFRSSEKT
jgi:hypothetical protein